MNGTSLINGALRLTGVVAQGEATGTSDATLGLEALNMMIGSWFSNGVSVPYTVTESLTLTASTASYTIGTGATLDTTYPEKILSILVRDSNDDYPLTHINQKEYWEYISSKTVESMPSHFFYDALNVTGKLYFYPTPDEAYTIYLISEKNLAVITDPALTIAIPRVYEEAMKFNLAVRLAPEYGVEPQGSIVAMAMQSYKAMIRSNLLKRPVGSVSTNGCSGAGGQGSIITGG